MSKRLPSHMFYYFDISLNLENKALKHPVNHVLIQFYRSGADYISDHSDKTIDIVRGSNIANVSLGATRTMTLRLKRNKSWSSSNLENDEKVLTHWQDKNISPSTSGVTPRDAQRISLPHNSMFVMGLDTNAKWLHGINRDNRPLKTKSPDEQFEGGARISLTFRHIGTFMSNDGGCIWGQGAKSKTKEGANSISVDKEEVENLIQAFSDENQKSNFDWDGAYGQGFDVLHFST